jgi:light-regulated signal transduction histidine kinase (bacteriophytochrome)
MMENLLRSAWRFTSKRTDATFNVGRSKQDPKTFYVADNGVGFDMAHASQLFAPFGRLHSAAEFEGTGIGLATVQRIVRRHGDRIWAESKVGEGATFFFTLPPDQSR